MSIGQEFRKETEDLVGQLQQTLADAILGTDDRIALPPDSEAALADFYEPLPELGNGAADTINRIVELTSKAGGNTPGPKCFHFVIGGSTPAALAADLLATAYEQVTYTWVLSPVGVQMEVQGARLVEGDAWLAEKLAWRNGHRCDDGEFRLSCRCATMVGRTAWQGRFRNRTGRNAADAGAHIRFRSCK